MLSHLMSLANSLVCLERSRFSKFVSHVVAPIFAIRPTRGKPLILPLARATKPYTLGHRFVLVSKIFHDDNRNLCHSDKFSRYRQSLVPTNLANVSGWRAKRPFCSSHIPSDSASPTLTTSSSSSLGNQEVAAESKVARRRETCSRPRVTIDGVAHSNKNTNGETSGKLSDSSRKLLEANEDFERQVWRAARNYHQSDHYDYSLFGIDSYFDQAVGRHQRETMLYNQDRHLKEEQARLVAPGVRQSPIAIMSVNPTYELQNKPLIIEYPTTVENLRLNNTGFSWEVKIPYQISMTTALYGAHLNTAYRYRLEQFHCHWGLTDSQGSEHTVDSKCYSAEMHFVHYNMEKYHTLSKAARHPDGLVVVSVFLDAQENHHNHAELEKIVAHLKSVSLKGEHTILKHLVRIENLLPPNRSYWSYQGSLTTPPYFESVTWFVLKQPIKCNRAQIQKFRDLKSTLGDHSGAHIVSNHRKTQPLLGRTIVTYDEPVAMSRSTSHSH